MEFKTKLNKYSPAPSEDQVAGQLSLIREKCCANETTEAYKLCYRCLDLTTLNSSDSKKSVEAFVRRVVEFPNHYAGVGNVASICVFPPFVDVAGLGIGNSDIAITSVAGGFPSSQTFLEVKMLEVAMAVENGADEIDVVINVGQLLEGDYDLMTSEIQMLRDEVGEDIIFKVIIESGVLKENNLIRDASLLAMFAGANFVKTSTGKISEVATPQAAVVICSAIRDFYEKTGKKVGFKVAGGVQTAAEAVLYYTIVQQILGEEWLTPELFRIGASSLANNLLTVITGKETKYF